MYIVKFSGILMCILYSIVAFDCCLNLGELLDLHSCVDHVEVTLVLGRVKLIESWLRFYITLVVLKSTSHQRRECSNNWTKSAQQLHGLEATLQTLI